MRVEVCFGLCWRDIPDRSEQPAIVEPVDPFEGGELDILEASPRPPLSDHLRFVEADDRLGESVVVTVADTADGGCDPGLGKALAIFDRDVLDAAVAVVDEIVTALAGPTLVESLLQCMENELGGRSTRDLPADDPSGEDVDGPVQRAL